MPENSQPKVLVVDEEPSVASIYRMVLEEQGYRVATCDSYDCGRKRLKQQPWDATLIEMELGTSDLGLKLAQEAKKLEKAPLVILSTGYPTVEALREALQLRVDYLLMRPADAEEMTRFLQRELARREVLKQREVLRRGES
ncbi:MAG TPA: response regulator [Candidatus Sulfotelmatobacter sp.]|nr:response regulator [Candidatus Sulfotelmatobacter sp.]